MAIDIGRRLLLELCEEISALVGHHVLGDALEGFRDPVKRTGGSGAPEMREFEEELLGRVQTRRIFGKNQQFFSHGTDRPANRLAVMGAEIVRVDDIARLQGGSPFGFDIGLETLPIDLAIQHPWRFNPVVAQRRDEDLGLSGIAREGGLEPLAALTPAAKRSHVRPGPRLVEEYQPLGSITRCLLND